MASGALNDFLQIDVSNNYCVRSMGGFVDSAFLINDKTIHASQCLLSIFEAAGSAVLEKQSTATLCVFNSPPVQMAIQGYVKSFLDDSDRCLMDGIKLLQQHDR